jgi:DNA-binding transcriptional LysR family regulator
LESRQQLEAFCAAIEQGSLSRAKEQLGVSQPAVSKLIQRLEAELGFALFEHSQGTLRPTPQARRLYEMAAQALLGLRRASDLAHEIRTGGARRIHIISNPVVALALLPAAVAEFQGANPDHVVSIATRNSESLRDLIAAQAYDLGIAELPRGTQGLTVHRQRVECVCVMPGDHPLARHATVTPALVAPCGFLAPRRDRPIHHRLDEAFRKAGVEWKLAVEADFGATLVELVRNGAGIAIVDRMTARLAATRGGVVFRPLRPRVDYEFSIFRPSRLQASPPVAALLSTLQAHVKASAVKGAA